MSQPHEQLQLLKRRSFLARSGVGLGACALGSLMQDTAIARPTANSLPGFPHIPPRVKRVIFLCMAGGPSHLETFDYKPKLAEMDGKPMPTSYTDNQPIAELEGHTLKCD